MAKSWLKEHAFEYEEELIDNEEERLAFYQTINGTTEVVGETNSRRVNSVPQIFIDDKRIGGYDDLMKMSDELLKKRSGGGLLQFSQTYKPFHYPWAVEITTRHEKAH
jgi:ribonucleoside-diphosphate reductase beta chain